MRLQAAVYCGMCTLQHRGISIIVDICAGQQQLVIVPVDVAGWPSCVCLLCCPWPPSPLKSPAWLRCNLTLLHQAEKELREKRKQEALAAKRYPMDDLELLSEELTAAAAAALAAQTDAAAAEGDAGATASGTAAVALLPAQQVDLTCLSEAQHLDEAAAQHMGQMLYVADTLGQFGKQLGLKGCTAAELQATLDAVAAGAAVGAGDDTGDGKLVREALAWLACTYQGLLKVGCP